MFFEFIVTYFSCLESGISSNFKNIFGTNSYIGKMEGILYFKVTISKKVGLQNGGKAMEREQLLEIYKKMRDAVSKLLEEQERLEEMSAEYEAAEQEENAIRTKVGFIFKLGAKLALVAVVFGFVMFGQMLSVSVLKAVLCFVAGIIGGLIILCVGNAIDDKLNLEANNAKADEYHKSTVEPMAIAIDRTKEIIDTLWNTEEMKQFEKRIPSEYKTLEAMIFFVHALEIGRADTEKELYNLYEEELHRKHIEHMQTQQLQYAEQTLQTQQQQLEAINHQNRMTEQELVQLQNIQKRQKKLSRQARYGNVVSTLNYLKKR